MATLPQAKAAIYSAFMARWNEPDATPYTFDNEQFDPPEPDTEGFRQSWVRLTVRHTGRSQQTMGKAGNRKYTRVGAAFIQVFTATDIGTAEADRLAEMAANIFEGVKLLNTSVWFKDVITRETGVDGSWYGVIVEAEFEYEEIK